MPPKSFPFLMHQEQGSGVWSVMNLNWTRMRLVRECWCSNARNAQKKIAWQLHQAHSIVLFLQARGFDNLIASNDLSHVCPTCLDTNQKPVWNSFHFLARNHTESILRCAELSDPWHKQKDLAVFPTLGTFVFSKLEHQYTKCCRCAKRHIWLDPNTAESHKSPPNTGTSGPRWQAASMERPFVGGWDGLLYQLPKPRTDCDGDVQKELLKLKTELLTNIAAKFKSYLYTCYTLWRLYTVSQNHILLICSSFSWENDHPLLMNAHQDRCKFYILHPSPPLHLQTILQLEHSISAWIARRPTHLFETSWGASLGWKKPLLRVRG